MKTALTIKQANGNNLNIEIEDKDLLNHVLNPNSYIPTILDQINNQEIYKFYFEGKENLTVIDAGANVGMFSLYVYPVCKKLYAIEPTPSHFNLLKKTTAHLSNIELLNYAVWKTDENILFYIQENVTANTTIGAYGSVNSVSVTGKKLQTIVKENNIEHVDFIKFDIEGSEYEVLTEDEIKFLSPIVDNWYFEFHSHVYPHEKPREEQILKLFVKYGYTVDQVPTDKYSYFAHK